MGALTFPPGALLSSSPILLKILHLRTATCLTAQPPRGVPVELT